MKCNGFLQHCICFYVVLSVISVATGFLFNNDSFVNLRERRATNKCDGFTCASDRRCIKIENRCDGKEDCQDGSDEYADCKTEVQCPGYLFTCDYGACIDADKKCDRKSDCRDNSDEKNCVYSNNEEQDSGNCKSNEFQCQSGQCISKDNKCNGVADCTDKSDETRETCLNMFCPGFTYKCDYGACVDGYAECNGKKDCIDNSDERNCMTNKPTSKPTDKPPVIVVPPSSQGCMLPDHPENGKWAIIGGARAEPKTKVSVNTLLTYSCRSGYKLSSQNALSLCSEKGWSAETPTCSILCPPLYTTEVTQVSCYNENKAEIKCSEATEGAYATFVCSPYYEPVDRVPVTRFCRGGTWNLPAPQCIPACGEKRVSAVPLIVNGKNVDRGDYPWVTALYRRQGGEFINSCGGSMLTQRVIVTAAHCVTYEDSKGAVVDKDILRIAVGKYYNKFMDPRDTQAQYSSISEILVHSKYKGEAQNFASDIAFLVTTDTLLLSKVVQPVCYHNLNNIPLNNRMQGVITGWGYTTAGGNPSDELKEILIPYKEDGTCEAELPSDWSARYFSPDKMCAGHYNKSIAVCKGDSGGGLVFPYKDGRYYIHGIVSVGYKVTAGCDIQLSTLFTKVSFHSEWLELVTAKYS
ncbi:modular serine protease-like [Diorhabda sublineata]|uniref:modular serine protease-like n=1 Tax=Diorhabda sublineata TaxID=1163346 RepID=UPI0024E04867|nr:modular serine protease-like [Diorhabda sublineata]